jgi:TATA-box binding protein (TBP) (component of TFIID and TFIIIB)
MKAEPVTFHNLFITFDLELSLDLEKLYSQLPNVAYDSEISPLLEVRDKTLGLTFQISRSGKVVCFGAKDRKSAIKGLKTLTVSIAKVLGITIPKPKIHVENYVATITFGRPLRLRKASYLLPDSKFDMKFSALRYMPSRFCSFQIFRNGIVICTGAKNKKQAREAFRTLKRTLTRYNLFEKRVP